MKTLEDEAFDELAKRQGDWGGGYQAKRVMAADKLQEPVSLRRGDILRCIETDELCTVWATSTTGKTLIKWSANNFGSYTAEQIGELFWLEPKPAQEPDALTIAYQSGYHDGKKAALVGREWNFCERCGKRTNDIHTCTPPQGDA